MPLRSRFARISRAAVAVRRADAVVVATVSRHVHLVKPAKAVAMATVARAKVVMPVSRVIVPMAQAVMVSEASSATHRVPLWQRTAAVMLVPTVAAAVMSRMAASAAIKPRNPASVRVAAVAAQASESKDNAQHKAQVPVTKGRDVMVVTAAMARTRRAGRAAVSAATLRNAVRAPHAEMASVLPC